MTDFNNDGKETSEDYYLYTQLSETDNKKPVYKSSGKLKMLVPGLCAIAYISYFLKGSLGFGPVRLILAIISAVVVFVWIFGD